MSGVERYYDLRQVAEITAYSLLTIRRFVKDGQLKSERWGREFRISESSLKKFIEDRRAQPIPPSSTPGHWAGKDRGDDLE